MASRQAELLQKHREEILALAARYGALNVRVFGSVARGEEQEDSDVDLLIDYDDHFDLMDLIGFSDDVEELIGIKVDVVTDYQLEANKVPVPSEAFAL
jgi:uncharacterized protein